MSPASRFPIGTHELERRAKKEEIPTLCRCVLSTLIPLFDCISFFRKRDYNALPWSTVFTNQTTGTADDAAKKIRSKLVKALKITQAVCLIRSD